MKAAYLRSNLLVFDVIHVSNCATLALKQLEKGSFRPAIPIAPPPTHFYAISNYLWPYFMTYDYEEAGHFTFLLTFSTRSV